MNTEKIYDLIGIGIGPFNLGLAALTQNIETLDCLFIEKNNSFKWHPGLLLPNAKMQVPFYADLVSLADPTSIYSYMNYLKQTGKLFRFAINESYFPYRIEYNEYCQWVAQKLNNVYFGQECKSISYDKNQKVYYISVLDTATAKIKVLTAKHLVIGTGSTPYIPPCATGIQHPNIFHASQYLDYKHVALMNTSITIIGSGQSAAEIFQDLLPHIKDLQSLHWYTRSPRLYAMDYSKFALELSSPEYIAYFYRLPKHKKAGILQEQHDLYKGINFELIEAIYEQLYILSLNKKNKLPVIQTNCELNRTEKADARYFHLHFTQTQTEHFFTHETETVILATGYKTEIPPFLDNIRQQINWTEDNEYAVNENYSIDNNNSIFVHNAEWHTHGFNSADLGLGPHRNAAIIDQMMNARYYTMQHEHTFQQF